MNISRTNLFGYGILGTTVMMIASVANGATLYVDINAAGGGNGSDTAPWNNLQTALTNATGGDTIRIAQGTYKPTTGNDRVKFIRRQHYTIDT